MGVERMGCGCLTSVYRDAGARVHGEDCMFTQDSTLMHRMYKNYTQYMRERYPHEAPWSFEGWQKHFKFKD